MQTTTCLLATPSLFPLWDESTGTNLNPEYLPISQQTRDRLNSWIKNFRHLSSGGSSTKPQQTEFELQEEGQRLRKILQSELKSSHKIVYISHVHGRVAEELFMRFDSEAPTNILDSGVLRREYEARIAGNPNDLCSRNSLAILLTEKFEDYQGAKEQFELVLESDPYDSTACYNLAMLLSQKLNDVAGARVLLEEALKFSPDDLYIRACYGSLLMYDLVDPRGALEQFNQALDWDPNFEIANFHAAVLHEKETGDYDMARFHYERMIKNNTREPVVYNNLANLLMHQFAELESANRLLDIAIKLDDQISEVYASKGVLLKDYLGAPARAGYFFKRAVEINPHDNLSRLNLAETAMELKDWETADENLQILLELDTSHALAHARLAEILIAKGLLEESLEHLEKSLDLQEDDPHTHNTIAFVINELGGDPSISLEHWRRALELKENLPCVHLNLGTCLFKSFSDLEGATNHLRRAIELDSGLVDAHNNLAQVFLTVGELDLSKEHHQLALKLDKKNPLLHENMANFHLLGDQDYEMARVHFIAALTNGLDTTEIRFNLGILMMDVFGDFRKAMEHFKRCIELNAEDHSAHARLALIYSRHLHNENAARYHDQKAKKYSAISAS